MRALAGTLLAVSLVLSASSSAAPAPNAVGTAYYSGGPHRQQVAQEGVRGLTVVAVQGTTVVRRTVTGARGGFALRLAPGPYVLRLQSGTPAHTCGAAALEVKAHQLRHLKLYCNIS